MRYFTRRFICYIGLSLLILIQSFKLSATDLGVGDLAFVSFNTDVNDSFSFVLLTDISGTTTIYFTDSGWDDDADAAGDPSPGWASSEGTLTWTYTGALSCGTEIAVLSPGAANTASGFATLDGTAELGSLTESGTYNLSASNDAIIAYTGTGIVNDASEVTNFIAAVYIGTGGWTSNASSTTTSAVPLGLTDTENAMVTKSGNDNWAYDCSVVYEEVGVLRASLNNNLNFGNGTTATADTTSAFNCTFTCASAAMTYTWTGTTDTNWATATNWSGNAVPTESDDVVIPDVANDPVITTNVEVSSIDIEASAVLTISTNSLKINNNTTLNGELNIASGASFFPWAMITGSGSATVLRSTTFSDSDGKYSVIGSPIAAGSTSSLGNIVYSYDETIAFDPGASEGSNRFVSVAAPESMSVGDAYFSANSGDISFSGMPNSWTHDLDLVYDEGNDGGATNAGFNLVSNPYTAAIEYSKFVAANTDIDGTVYIWDDGGSNVGARTSSDYITANSIGSASGGSTRSGDWDGYIRSTQGFFVKATAAEELYFTPGMMSVGNNTDGGYFRSQKSDVIRLSIASNELFDDILIAFADEATEGIDRSMDAYKINSGNTLQLYTKVDEAKLAIQALPSIGDERIVHLGFDAKESGFYTLNINDHGSYVSEIFLVDHLLNQTINLSQTGAYSFESKSVSGSDRFSLIFNRHQVLSLENSSLNNEMIVFDKAGDLNIRMNSPIENATIHIYNIGGVLVERVPQAFFIQNEWNMSFHKSGLFIITLESEGQLFTQKFMK